MTLVRLTGRLRDRLARGLVWPAERGGQSPTPTSCAGREHLLPGDQLYSPVADQQSGEANVSRYPMHRMVAVLDDAPGVQATLDGLAGRGIDSSDAVVLTGEEGVSRLDPNGEGHGLSGRLLQVLQLTAEEGDALELHHQALAEGKSLVYVKVHGEAQKDKAAEALTGASGNHLAYFGRWTLEKLQLGGNAA